MILKASHHPVIYPFFRFYTKWKISRNFHGVIIKGEIHDMSKPVLLISNHFSWWDGFWVMYLNMKIFRRKFWFMMQEENLRKHIFFNKTGGYSVKKGTRSIIETLDYTAELLKDEKNLVLIFPQGEIQPMRTEKVSFEKGIFHILNRAGQYIHIIFLVNIIEYYSNPLPTLYMHIKEYVHDSENTEDAGSSYQEFYKKIISEYSGSSLTE